MGYGYIDRVKFTEIREEKLKRKELEYQERQKKYKERVCER